MRQQITTLVLIIVVIVSITSCIASSEIRPTPTVISATPATVPACLTKYFVPIVFMPDNRQLLVRGETGVQVFNLHTLELEPLLAAPTNLAVGAIALSPDGKTLAWALTDNTVQLIRLTDHQLLHTLRGHTDSITKLKFSPTGDKLFSASHDTWVRVWNVDGSLVYAFQPTGADNYPSEVVGMAISPDGTQLATIPFDGPAKLWRGELYTLVRELGGSGGYDTSDIVFSPDGRLVAADLATGLFLWKVSDGTELLGGNPGINSMAVSFSPNGRYLAYAETGEKSTVVLSSPDGSQRIRTLEGHQAPIWELLFSSDSSLLASVDDVEIRIWRVEDEQLLFMGTSVCP